MMASITIGSVAEIHKWLDVNDREKKKKENHCEVFTDYYI